MRARLAWSVLLLLMSLMFGCGSAPTATPTTTQRSSLPPGLAARLRQAEHPSADSFPKAGTRSLQALAGSIDRGPQIGLAASVLLPGVNRVAFGLIASDRRFIYGQTALYIARSPSDRAQGPFLAPADSFVPSTPFLSKTAAQDTADIKAIYATQLTLPKPGKYAVLAVTRVGTRLLAAASQLVVQATSPIPNVGDRPPAISTDTVASAHGDLAKIDTRQPHDDMHKVNFKDVVGKRPVALLFATPQLCQSRVCGPVTDLELELEHTYGDRMTFIHEEVYVENDVSKGLRPQLKAFGLQTEPWLFTFDKTGRVAARLEGAFGINAFRAAVQAALR